MYGKIDCQFWVDPYIRKAPEDARILMLYYLTTPSRNIIGLFHLPEPLALYHLSWTANRYNEALNELVKNKKIKVDTEADLIFITNFLKWNDFDNLNQVKGAIAVLEKMPQTPLFVDLYNVSQTVPKAILEPLRNRLETLSKPFRNGLETLSNTITITDNRQQITGTITSSYNTKKQPKEKNEKISTNEVQELLDKYHEILPMLPKIQILSSAAIVNAKILLAEFGQEFITNTFKDIATQKWLHGGNNNNTGWAPDFGWLMVKDNFAKVVNGVYKRLSQKSEKSQTKYERDMAALDAMINAGAEQEEIIDLGVINNDGK